MRALRAETVGEGQFRLGDADAHSQPNVWQGRNVKEEVCILSTKVPLVTYCDEDGRYLLEMVWTLQRGPYQSERTHLDFCN